MLWLNQFMLYSHINGYNTRSTDADVYIHIGKKFCCNFKGSAFHIYYKNRVFIFDHAYIAGPFDDRRFICQMSKNRIDMIYPSDKFSPNDSSQKTNKPEKMTKITKGLGGNLTSDLYSKDKQYRNKFCSSCGYMET